MLKRGTSGVAAQLHQLIYSGEIHPGEHLRQDELATRLGVSRVPLREAMLVLTSQGILTHETNRGFQVVKRAKNEQSQIRWLLETLENEVYRNIEWPGEEDLEALTEINAKMREALQSQDPAEAANRNFDFHIKLWSFNNVDLIANELKRVWGMSITSLARVYEDEERIRMAIGEHEQIIEALRAQDTEALFETTELHRTTSSGVYLRRNPRG